MEPLLKSDELRRENTLFNSEDLAELDFIDAPIEDEYLEAYERGKDGSCWRHYSNCPINIFKMLHF